MFNVYHIHLLLFNAPSSHLSLSYLKTVIGCDIIKSTHLRMLKMLFIFGYTDMFTYTYARTHARVYKRTCNSY